MGFLSILGIGIFLGKCIKAACEPTLPAGYHGNWKLEAEDANKVRMGQMTKREFLRNMDRGKYYAPPEQEELDPKLLNLYYGLKWMGTFNDKCDYGKYNFIKDLTKEEAFKRKMELPVNRN